MRPSVVWPSRALLFLLPEELGFLRYLRAAKVTMTMCVCVCCVVIPFILDVGFVAVPRYQPGSHRGGKLSRISLPSFCGACLNFYREKDLAIHFPRRLWSRILCTHELIVLHLLGIYFYFLSIYIFSFVRKNTRSCDCTESRTHVPTSEGFEVTN